LKLAKIMFGIVQIGIIIGSVVEIVIIITEEENDPNKERVYDVRDCTYIP
jgi:hypothetical protein